MSVTRHQAVGAYRRWEPQSFDDTGPATDSPVGELPNPEIEQAQPASDSADVDVSTQAQVVLPTAEEIEAMFDRARAEGHSEGRAEGHAAGFAAGHAEGLRKGQEEARREATKLAALVGAMDEALDALDGEVAEEIVVLAIELARQMVRHTLADHPGAVAETVREALQQLPQNQISIHLHPDDAHLVRESLGDTLEYGHHRIIEDESITRGGCRLQAAGSEIDSSMQTRWQRTLESLGRSDANWGE